MKFKYKPSPSYRNWQSTDGIMLDLTACLCAVLLFAAVYYGIAFGLACGLRVILMALVAVVSAVASEAIYFKVTGAKDIKQAVLHSYGWVTALIIVLISRLDVSLYAIIIATAVSIIFGKLVFGGFGQNIFNPAAFGEAIIMNYFAASKAAKVTADVFTGATPVARLAANGWIMNDSTLSSTISAAGGYGALLLGSYPSVIGGSCGLLLLLCGAFMIWRKDIDWHLSCAYLLSIFVVSLVVGLIKGAGIQFAIVNLLTGGVLFGAVFMMTDPVTTPLTIPGRMIFAFGCACLTLLIRWKANLPDGVLFSILLMNMLTPAIDKWVNGNQIRDAVKIRNKVIACGVIFTLLPIIVGALTPVEASTSSAADSAPAATSFVAKGDYSANKASCTSQGNGVYACKADGYLAQSGEGDANEAIITIKDGKVVSVEMTAVNDSPGISDSAVSADALAAYVGVSDPEDAVTGATAAFTEGSIKAMVAAALEAASK
jgi:electron transport complex protein RnfD